MTTFEPSSHPVPILRAPKKSTNSHTSPTMGALRLDLAAFFDNICFFFFNFVIFLIFLCFLDSFPFLLFLPFLFLPSLSFLLKVFFLLCLVCNLCFLCFALNFSFDCFDLEFVPWCIAKAFDNSSLDIDCLFSFIDTSFLFALYACIQIRITRAKITFETWKRDMETSYVSNSRWGTT